MRLLLKDVKYSVGVNAIVNSDNFFANLVSNLTYSQYIAAHFENNRGLFTIQFPTNRNSQNSHSLSNLVDVAQFIFQILFEPPKLN